MKYSKIKAMGMNCDTYIKYLIMQGYTTVLEMLKNER